MALPMRSTSYAEGKSVICNGSCTTVGLPRHAAPPQWRGCGYCRTSFLALAVTAQYGRRGGWDLLKQKSGRVMWCVYTAWPFRSRYITRPAGYALCLTNFPGKFPNAQNGARRWYRNKDHCLALAASTVKPSVSVYKLQDEDRNAILMMCRALDV